MNSKALGGLFLVVVGAGALWLWYRGYFTAVINTASAGLGNSGQKVGFFVGGKPAGGISQSVAKKVQW